MHIGPWACFRNQTFVLTTDSITVDQVPTLPICRETDWEPGLLYDNTEETDSDTSLLNFPDDFSSSVPSLFSDSGSHLPHVTGLSSFPPHVFDPLTRYG